MQCFLNMLQHGSFFMVDVWDFKKTQLTQQKENKPLDIQYFASFKWKHQSADGITEKNAATIIDFIDNKLQN